MLQVEPKFRQVKKRDGRIVDFDQPKITEAIFKALTAAKKGGKRIAQKLSDQVVDLLNRRLKKGNIPQIEEIQDIVEEVLIINDYTETAKSYILYREQRRRIREATMAIDEAVDMVDQYIQELDWQVKENANMAYSLQGLNHHVVSKVAKKYWLNKIYPKEIREAVDNGDFHIHDLDSLSCYCQGWDLYDILLKGFGGVKGKVESKPAKHLQTALGQLVNFFYTLQGETAGAEAVSSFDTLLAPFIWYDNLNYNQVRQAMQEFLFNCAVPTRVGFQCVSEDTEILTPQGWKDYQEVNKGDEIKTFNLSTGKIEDQKVNYVFKKKYNGIMYRLKNRIQDQLVSPNHRVVRKKFQTDKYILEPIEEIMKLKSPFAVPIAAGNSNKSSEMNDEQIKLMAWIISEGTIERPGKHRCCYRVSIYQSKIKNPRHYKEIVGLLKHFNLDYSEYETASLGDSVRRMRLNAESSRIIHKWFGTKENIHFMPDDLLNLDKRQSRLFIETYLEGDGFEGCKIGVTDLELLDGLQIACVNAGYGFTVSKRKPTIGKKDIYVLRLIKHTETYIPKVEKVDYKGVIWSPNTKNETIIARRKGSVFITGNTPFINVTLDIKPSPSFAKQPVIIGGKPQKEIYGDFQGEMNMFNRAFYECLMEGDRNGQPFTFPIPTVSITDDFDWDNPDLDPMWQATAKYGVNYFSNFIQSDMKPEDVRSMCMMPQEELFIRNNKRIKRVSIKEVVENYRHDNFDKDGWVNCKKEGNLQILSLNPKTFKTEWSPVKRFLRVFDNQVLEIITEDGKKTSFSVKHPMAVFTEEGLKMKFAKDIQRGDYLISLKQGTDILAKKYQKMEELILDEDLAKILGYFVADGNYLFESRKGYTYYGQPRGLQFTFKTGDKENLEIIKSLIRKVFDTSTKEKQDPRYNTYYLYVYNSLLARKLYEAGFRKYGRLPQILFDSPAEVIKSFLDYHFKGDGYEKRKEIHINDLDLSRDLVLLYSLVGQPVTYKLRKRSQRIYLQHSKGRIKQNNGWLNNPILAERIPGWMAQGNKIPGFSKSRMIGFNTIEKYNAHSRQSQQIKNSDIYITRVKAIKKRVFKKVREFFDIELAANHLFIHSLGTVSFNCCRLRLNNKELYKRGGGLFGSAPLTGSIGVCTVNLPRLSYLSKTKKEFFDRLAQIMNLSKESLEIKRKVLEKFIEEGLYPYSKYYLAGVKKMRGQYFGNHFSTIGLIGMNEALLNFIGADIGSQRGRRFALEILDFMRQRLVGYQKETDNLYNLEATPAEGTSYRLALKDKEEYPDIVTAGAKETPYYTNSTMLPVNYTDDIFEALKLQDDIQTKYTGGVVLHFFLGEQISDIQAIKNLIKKIFGKFRLPYITLTPTFSICPHHGYIAGEHFTCPKCVVKQPCEVYSRVVGYIRPVQQWNPGKQEEFKERKVFKVKKQ